MCCPGFGPLTCEAFPGGVLPRILSISSHLLISLTKRRWNELTLGLSWNQRSVVGQVSLSRCFNRCMCTNKADNFLVLLINFILKPSEGLYSHGVHILGDLLGKGRLVWSCPPSLNIGVGCILSAAGDVSPRYIITTSFRTTLFSYLVSIVEYLYKFI